MRFLARVRLRMRRARWVVFFVGIAFSALLLGYASCWPDIPLIPGSDYQITNPGDALVKFLILNPPAFLPFLSFGFEPNMPAAPLAALFSTSVAWWLSIAILLRRRHARPYQTAFV